MRYLLRRVVLSHSELPLALSLAVVTALALPASAKASESADGSEEKPSLTYAANHHGSGWLPFTLKNKSRIMIPATVNGQKVEVLIDSGAGATVLDRRFVKSLGLKSVGDLTAQGSGGSGQYGIVKDVVIRLGDLTIKNSTTVGVNLKPLEDELGFPLPMVLGGAAFNKTVVDIEFKKHRIAFRDPATFDPPQDMHGVALTPAGGGNRALDMQVEGQPARMVFDLGNSGAADMFPRFWKHPAFLKHRLVSSTLAGGWGGIHTVKSTHLRGVRLAGTTFNGVPSTLMGMHSSDALSGKLDGNLGMALLGRFHLIVDFPHNQVLFGSPVGTATPFALNTTGLHLRSVDQGKEIRHVSTGSPAEKAGLKAGDVITQVHDARTDAVVPFSSDWESTAPGHDFRLVLSDGRTVVLRTAKYY